MSATRISNRRAEPALAQTDGVVEALAPLARPLARDADLDPLMARIGDARYVLLGEASHGTSEFYAWRDRLTRRLIVEKGFSFVGVEGDWPDCERVNRYVRGREGESARAVLHAFDRWPTWMWANREVQAFAEWLRARNDGLPEAQRAGFYGLDVYSLWDSMRAVVGYLDRTDPEAGAKARKAYECFAPYGEDEQLYARATALVPSACEREVIEVLTALRRDAKTDRASEREAHFNAEQNALTVRDAERYYRAMVRGGALSWNVRDQHMADTLERLMAFHGPRAKCVVWEHNTHVGDARYTDMAGDGEFNLGQLIREAHAADDVVLVGFSTHRGTVIAGEGWGEPMKVMRVPEARAGSIEDAFHRLGRGDTLAILPGESAPEALMISRGHRAIGVVYRPAFERFGNYVPTVLPMRYDAMMFIDETRAVAPLHMPEHGVGEGPETFPSGM